MLEETEQALFKEDDENINLYSALKKCFIYLFILTKLLLEEGDNMKILNFKLPM